MRFVAWLSRDSAGEQGIAVRPEAAGRARGDAGAVESEVELATETPKDELQRRFTELLGANGPALGRLAASYTRSAGDRDDLFQEIALAIWRALPRFRGECSERTFIFRIAHNRAISHIAQRSPISALEGELDPADPRPNPERESISGTTGRAPPASDSTASDHVQAGHHADFGRDELLGDRRDSGSRREQCRSAAEPRPEHAP